MPLTAGARLGPYEIVSPIGAGGMGEVYKARDTKLDRDVAIKVLAEELASDAERLGRFEREAKLLASLNHPNIASIHGFEESGCVSALVLEFVEGPTLAERIEKGPIPVDEALAIAKQIAEALEAGHDAGVIHRDLKPANIKLKEDGTVKVLDYGLAKALKGDTPTGTDSELSQSPTLTRQTQVGVILGTAAYMSPEQAKGKRVDRRADIWAFGAVVYEMLTSRRAFAGEDVSDTLAAVLRAEPEWDSLPPEVPAKLHDLLTRCLKKEPRQRLQHVGDARITIDEALRQPTLPAPPALHASIRRTHLAILIGATAIVAATLTWLLSSPTTITASPVTRSVIPLAPSDELFLEHTTSVAISPDGRSIVFVGDRDNAAKLYLRRLEELDATPIEGTEGGRMPFFSPDGQWVGFKTDAALMKVSLGGGAPVAILREGGSGRIRGASWSDEETIVFTDSPGSGLSKIAADGGRRQALTRLDTNQSSHRLMDVLPDGNAVLFTQGMGDMVTWDDASIAVLDLESGRHRVVVERGTNPQYSPSGHLVYARAGSLLAVPFDPDSLEVQGVPVTVLDHVTTSPVTGQAEFQLARNGSLIYAPGGSWGDDRRVVWVDRDGGMEPLIETRRAFEFPRLSPDGRFLALQIDAASVSVWVYDLSRGILSQLAAGYNHGWPAWTPDGARVAFYSARSGRNEIFWRLADASAEPELLSSSEHNRQPHSWTKDGKTLFFVEFHPDTGADVWTFSTGGTETPLLQNDFNEDWPTISPSGQWMAYQSDESGQPEIYIRSFPITDRNKWKVSSEGGMFPRWNPNGRELFYRQGDTLMAVDVGGNGELILGQPQALFEKSTPWGQYDVDEAGARFVMADTTISRKPPTELILVQNWSEELKRLVPAP